jgi:hypothetical protein
LAWDLKEARSEQRPDMGGVLGSVESEPGIRRDRGFSTTGTSCVSLAREALSR